MVIFTDITQITGPYSCLIADCPWRFASNSKAKPGRNAQRHYDCMTTPEIAALPVRDFTAKKALLLLWCTSPMLPQAMSVGEAWGFKYVSQLVWPKKRIGTGYWVRNRHEVVLIMKRGAFPAPKPAMFPDSIIPGAQREHSRKPDWLHEVVENRLPDTRRIELFARAERPGWDQFGDQVGSFAA